MKKILITIIPFTMLYSCKKEYEVINPNTATWEQFSNPDARSLGTTARHAMEAVYTIGEGEGNSFFGADAALKWSYAMRNGDTIFHLSGFLGQDIGYFICEGKQLNGSILLNGYWRKMVSTETGLLRLSILPAAGADLLLSPNPLVTTGSITINGVYGNENAEPLLPLSLVYNRPLFHSGKDFQIMAHRSGGRTSDLLPHSENSLPMILKTSEFGSTGIEIDVRFTKDGIPILYHDNTLNLRLIQKSGLVGKIENYTYDQLSTFVRLIHGERIPTLREALNTVLYQTPLSIVWLDTKYSGSIAPIQAIQSEYLQRAANAGRNLEILIGLPGQEQFDQFEALPNNTTIPSLCELSIEDAARINARVWAPRFTEGTQVENVSLVQSQGRRAFVWTLDVPEFIKSFIRDGKFDGILSNFPSCVAYYYYVQQ